MIAQVTIRHRILIVFGIVILLGGGMQLYIAGRQLQLATMQFYQHELEKDGLLIATTLAETLEDYLKGKDSRKIGRALAALQQEIGHNYLIVDAQYRVIGYTMLGDYEPPDRIDTSPELATADSNRIGADVRLSPSGQDTLYVAVTILHEDKKLGYLVLSEPMQPVYDAVNRRYLELAGSNLPILGLVTVASFWVSETILRPIRRLQRSAMLMADGALETRLAFNSRDELGQLAQTFDHMAQQIETLVKAQRGFISNAAHELRTPLMTLRLRVDALTDEALSVNEQRQYLREIRREVDHMAELVLSLLVLARIDEGRYQTGKTTTDAVSTMHDVLRRWRIEAERQSLSFSATIDEAPSEMPISYNDLRLVLDNLLSNAVKYTPQGHIHVAARREGDKAIIEVQDTGIGFLPEHQERLFERFYRSEQVRGRFPGSGLGLSITEAVLETYGGKIEAYSEGLQRGATFKVTLPLKPSQSVSTEQLSLSVGL